jgi:hypothetical protein
VEEPTLDENPPEHTDMARQVQDLTNELAAERTERERLERALLEQQERMERELAQLRRELSVLKIGLADGDRKRRRSSTTDVDSEMRKRLKQGGDGHEH